MTFPDWTKPGIYGAVVGAIAISIFGFSWGGWKTAGSAQEMADSFAKQEVTQAMVPMCLRNATADADRAAKLATIKAANRFNRSKAVMDAGWATLPGMEAPNRDLAKACVEGLDLDA